ncbi:hypothetical protein MKZ38_001277 [Zalerion maritima]|uniref:DUF6604 domain-containing protein n=1 Tax=Zalerion maritima TaxID=339359 RepID=A0AAD5RRM3_9PEZI|nr:hypothetical protein MKZ38_001277 [Zalerion maritima]
MLPGSLTSIYGQYKHDTDVVATWLATTAKKCGYSADLVEPKPQSMATTAAPKKSGRLKGKARKQAMAKKGSGTPTQPAVKEEPKYMLAIKDFIPLSHFIVAATEHMVKVPSYFVITIKRVIKVRKDFSGMLEDQGETLGPSTVEKHSFFVGVLERVYEVLKPLIPKDAFDMGSLVDAVGEDSNRKKPTSSNPFDVLDVYEPSAEFLNAPDVEIPSSANTEYEAESEDDLEAAYFALGMLLLEFLKLRSQVKVLWKAYLQGVLELAAAAVAANTAIDLARSMEEDAAPLIEKHGGVEKMLSKWYYASCLVEGYDPMERELPGDDINMKTYEISDGMMYNVMGFLSAWTRACPSSGTSMYNGQYGWYDPGLNTETAPSRTKYQQDKASLMEMFPEFLTMGRFFKDNPIADHLSHGMRSMADTGQIPLWLVLAGQTLLDTMRILGSSLSIPFTDMARYNAMVEETIEGTLQMHRSDKVAGWPSSNNILLHHLQELARLWKSDPIKKLKEKAGFPSKSWLFLKRHPMYCGLWVHQMRLEIHRAGVAYECAWGTIMYSGHLYNALQSEKAMGDQQWADMELLFMFQGQDKFFVGSPPTNADGYFKAFCLCMGYSSSNWAPHRRGVMPAASRAGPRSLKDSDNVSTTFNGKFEQDYSTASLTAEEIQKIIDAGDWKRESDEDGMAVLERGPSTIKRGKGKAKRKPSGGAPTPAELIWNLALVLHAEVPEMTFDYFKMHRICWVLLGAIRKMLDAQIRTRFGLGYLENNSQLPFIVGYCFMAAVGKSDGPPTMELLHRAGATLHYSLQQDDLGRSVKDALASLGIAVEVQEDTED